MSHSQRFKDQNPLLPVHVYCIGGSFFRTCKAGCGCLATGMGFSYIGGVAPVHVLRALSHFLLDSKSLRLNAR